MSSSTNETREIPMGRRSARRLTAFTAAALLLGACSETGEFNFGEGFKSKPSSEEVVSRGAAPVETIEREVEAPEVFQAEDAGLWDGRPSLGGTWVAHPDVKDPERVSIRNAANGKVITGALFRRERETPGPRFQVSSDAAAELGLLAGAPAKLEVVALRKEVVPVEQPAPIEAELIEEPETVETASLGPIAAAEAAIEASEAPAETASPVVTPLETPETEAPKPKTAQAEPPAPGQPTSTVIVPEGQDQAALDARSSKPASAGALPPAPELLAQQRAAKSRLFKPFVQIGIFSQTENAENTAAQMRSVGIIPTVSTFERNGKTFSRVIVGPAMTRAERTALLTAIKDQGFPDAYAVSK